MAVGYPGDISARINSAGPASFQDQAGSGYPNLIATFVDDSMKKAAAGSAGPLVGKIVLGEKGGFFDVQLADGSYKRRIPNQYRTKWRIDDWVTITQVSGSYAITGPGAVQGG